MLCCCWAWRRAGRWTPFSALYAWAANGRAGHCEFQHLYGTLHATAIHVRMSPDCSKLGLGAWEISIAAGTGADVIASGAGAAGRPLARLSWVILVYACKHLQNLEYPSIIWDIPVLMTYLNISDNLWQRWSVIPSNYFDYFDYFTSVMFQFMVSVWNQL